MRTPSSIFLFLFSVWSLSSWAQRDCLENCGFEKDTLAIRANFSQQEACWNKGDLECYMEAYAPDGVIQTISRGGVTQGYQNILSGYKKNFPREKMGQLRFDQIGYTRLTDEYYYVVGRFNLSYPPSDRQFQGWFSVVMKKIDGQWLMISDHSS